jgi:hypothetical protein
MAAEHEGDPDLQIAALLIEATLAKENDPIERFIRALGDERMRAEARTTLHDVRRLRPIPFESAAVDKPGDSKP